MDLVKNMHATEIIINQAAFIHNLTMAFKLVDNRHIVAMFKANAYGHGIENLIPALNFFIKDKKFADKLTLGVATLEEAIVLRNLGVTLPVVISEGVFSEEELNLVIEYKFDIVIHNFWQLKLINKKNIINLSNLWLKIDTGMHRLGFEHNEFVQAKQYLQKLNANFKNIILMSHLACADADDNKFTEMQLERFKHSIGNWPGKISLANSAAILKNLTGTLFDIVRPGIMLYGLSPFADKTGKDFNLQPVMQLKARIIAIKTIHPGETVGYSATWKATAPTKIAVISIGYGDGYPRHINNNTPVWFKGSLFSIIGIVSMDMIIININSINNNINIGDEVELWGENLSVETIAAKANSIGYELVTQINHRRNNIKLIN